MLAKMTRADGRAFFRQYDMLCTWHLRAGLGFQGLGFGMLSWFGGWDGEEVDVTYLLSYNYTWGRRATTLGVLLTSSVFNGGFGEPIANWAKHRLWGRIGLAGFGGLAD